MIDSISNNNFSSSFSKYSLGGNSNESTPKFETAISGAKTLSKNNSENSSKSDSIEISGAGIDGEERKTEISTGTKELTEKEQKQVDNLKARDAEVRRHEQAHLAAAAGLQASGPFYQYANGPDGRKYAVGGEVRIDNSAEKEPQDTIRKMQRVRAAALAPADPSPQDRSVAAQASRTEASARQELAQEKSQEMKEGFDFKSSEPGTTTQSSKSRNSQFLAYTSNSNSSITSSTGSNVNSFA